MAEPWLYFITFSAGGPLAGYFLRLKADTAGQAHEYAHAHFPLDAAAVLASEDFNKLPSFPALRSISRNDVDLRRPPNAEAD